MMKSFSMDKVVNEPNLAEEVIKSCVSIINKNVKPVILFGAGFVSQFYLNCFIKFKLEAPLYFYDNNSSKWGTKFKGIQVIGFPELKEKYNESYILITSNFYADEMIEQLKREGLYENLIDPTAHDRIWSLLKNTIVIHQFIFTDYYNTVESNFSKFEATYQMLEDDLSKKIFYDRINYCITSDSRYLAPLKSKDPQYFEKEIIKLSKDEIFVDGGAYIGDTVEEFLIQTNGEFACIYSFEPEISKHKEFETKFYEDERIQLVPKGLWDKSEVLRFDELSSSSSQLNQSGDAEVIVTSIDAFLEGKPATFIKMDIEGAEMEGLIGAKHTIRRYRPKLAICIYHKPTDIVDIPLYIKSLVPDYKIYFRHYSEGAYETICYAVCE